MIHGLNHFYEEAQGFENISWGLLIFDKSLEKNTKLLSKTRLSFLGNNQAPSKKKLKNEYKFLKDQAKQLDKDKKSLKEKHKQIIEYQR